VDPSGQLIEQAKMEEQKKPDEMSGQPKIEDGLEKEGSNEDDKGNSAIGAIPNGVEGQGMNAGFNQLQPVSTLPPTADPERWKRNYDNLSSNDRQEMLVDEIFSLYLYRMSNRINQFYYKIVMAYVIFFRECLNEYGWGKKIESEGIRLENNPELKQDIETKQFCLVNNAEHAPEICNEFVTVYMEYKKNLLDIPKHDQIDLTINLCHWLFQCQFTCSKLTMIA
jgi:hypothetical protein